MTILGDKYTYEEREKHEGYVVPPIYKDNNKDEIPFKTCFALATALHPIAVGLAYLAIFILALLGVHFAIFDKPEQKPKDIEFVLVDKEQMPINKNTKYRSDRNSRAGGQHDPNRPVSMPTPSASPAPKQQAAQPQQAQPKQAQPQPQQPTPKKTVAPTQPQQQAPKVQQQVTKGEPTAPTNAPKPSLKPTAPKITQKPTGTFDIPAPKVDAPKALGPAGGPVQGSRTGASSGSSSGTPSPSFSPSGGSSSGGRFSSSGSSGSSGNIGNPGPGNPKGAPGIDAIKEPDFGPYMRELQRRIKMNWEPPKGNESKRVVLLFKIGRDGRLLSNKVFKSSGMPAADNAAKAAVELTAPFKPLPPEYKGDSVDIQFTFDYNVFGASMY